MSGLLAALFLQAFEHGQERRQAGTTGQHQHRALHRAQVKHAHGAGQGDLVTSLGLAYQPRAHQAPGHVADQEAQFAAAGTGAERVGAGFLGTRHLNVHILARQEADIRICGDLQLDGGRGNQVDLAHSTGHGLVTGLAAQRCSGRNFHHTVAGGHHLTGQHHALLGFLVRQRLVDVLVTHIELALVAGTLAGSADTVGTVHGQIDLGPVSGVEYGFTFVAGDHTGNAVFKIKRDVVTHDDALPINYR